VPGFAEFSLLLERYGLDAVASTTSLVVDDGRVIVQDPGMMAHPRCLLDPLAERGYAANEVTDVLLSHHHPDHTLNAGLFHAARFHDHWAVYQRDTWEWRDADGFKPSPHVTLLRTPGHTPEDISSVVETRGGIVVITHLWNTSASEGRPACHRPHGAAREPRAGAGARRSHRARPRCTVRAGLTHAPLTRPTDPTGS
jgi:glyoxylase-like metal-dependent hydrolase (beta-lactamase superfamily II)